MSKKKENEQLAPKGNRMNGKKASAERYIPFYEFLFFDPLYRGMKDKAKILYAFLRKKSLDNEEKTQKYEAGEEDFTRSYRDENGEIYVIADNSELSIILQCHPNRVKDQKDELKRYGLLEEVPRFKQSSLLYVLTPKEEQLTERWNYIEEIKTLRSKTEEENKKKADKHKAKKQAEKNDENPVVPTDESNNSQNVSYNNSQNVSYNNSQNVSKIYSKDFKSNPEILKSTLNLSITESSLPISIQKTLIKQIDRLIEYEIKISDIENQFDSVSEIYKITEYKFVLHNLLDLMTEKPRNFASVMNDWLKRNRVNQNDVPAKNESGEKTPIRKEEEPYWLNQEDQQPEEKNDEKSNIDAEQFEAEKKKLFDRIQKYKDSKNKEKVEA